MNSAIRIENLGKAYRKGPLHPGSIRELLSRATQRVLRRSPSGDPYAGVRTQEDAEGRFWALRDVTFDVQPGEVMGVVGSNGAGKSTLLKILSCITDPTEGFADVDGRVASLLEVGTGFHGELTGRENIFLNGVILGMSRSEIRRKFDEIVEFSGVESFIDTPVKRYSSGMYIRLAFAVAAHLESEILIVDEVLAVGDFEFQRKCLGRMNDIAASGRTVLFVSHNMAAVQSLCTSACLLEKGRLVTSGALHQTLQEYRQRARQNDLQSPGGLTLVESRHRRQRFFQNVSLLDERHRDINQIQPCGELRIRLAVDAAKAIEPQIRIGINDCTGHRILSLHSPVSASLASGIQSDCEVECAIPRLPLAPGEYWLELTATDGNRQIDAVEVSEPLVVAEQDVFGEHHGLHHGICVTESNWINVTEDRQVLHA